ncbi:SRPBCC family protein [Candidatus Parcubacteria bacterium]|nr:SRPBCC family protein [Candidatus Parcubacteria bacterium]
MSLTKITVKIDIEASLEKVWECFTEPEHIMAWNNASPDWHTPRAENDLRVGGTFNYRMEAKDGSAGFDFGGTYDEVAPYARIAYTIGDGRKVSVVFAAEGGKTRIVETFEAETVNPIELQKNGWQSILDNLKTYVESGAKH